MGEQVAAGSLLKTKRKLFHIETGFTSDLRIGQFLFLNG